MKKLMIVAAVALAAIASQAATASWKITAGNMCDGTTAKYAGTAYVYTTDTLTQQALYEAFAADTTYDFSKTAVASVTFSNGSIATASQSISFGEAGSVYSVYFVAVNGEDIYFSNILADKSAYNPPSAQSLLFASQNNNSTTFSATAAADGFQGAGKWSAVPEPTSGLLLLVGGALLALRRRRA